MTHLTDTVLNPAEVAHSRTVILVSVLLILFVCSICAASQKENAFAKTQTPQLLVLVWFGQGWSDVVSVCYDTQVDKDTVSKDISTFADPLGWSINNLQINTKKIPVPGATSATSATFETSTRLGAADAFINIDPIVLAFKRFAAIQISYLSGQDSELYIPAGFSDRQVSIDTTQNQGTYQFNINIKDHNIKRLNWPKEADQVLPGSSSHNEQKKQSSFAFTVLIATVCAVGAYFVTKKITTK